MSKYAKWMLVAGLIAVVVIAAGCARGGAVGVIDVNKVMAESPKVKALEEQLNAKGKELTDQLAKDKQALSEEEYKKKEEAAYGEFLKIKQDLESQVDASLKQAVEQVAKAKGLNVVLYKNGVAHGGVDVTDEVIKKMQ